MAEGTDDFDVELAEPGDDRPGIDELTGDDYSALGLDPESADSDDDEDGSDDEDDSDEDEDEDEDEDDDEDDDEDEDEDSGEDEDEEYEDDVDEYPEDATDEEIDIVAALYREDGRAAGVALPRDLANDLDGLIGELRRIPGEAGALGVVSIDSDFFVLVRVRGRVVQVLLSDGFAANDWPIARDAADFLGAEIPDDEDESEPVGDLDMFADVGLSEMELGAICGDFEADSLDLVETIVEKLGFRAAYAKVAASFDL